MKHLLVLISLFVFTGCKKKSDLSTKDTMTCNVDGKNWTASEYNSYKDGCSAELQNQKKLFILHGGQPEGSNGVNNIEFHLNDPSGVKSGDYILGPVSASSSNAAYYFTNRGSASPYFYTDSSYTGMIHLVFDESKSTVSGTFFFRALYDYTYRREVDVTDGTFSIKYSVH